MIFVFDDVLPDPVAYRAAALSLPFGDFQDDGVVFHGVIRAPDDELAEIIRARFPEARPSLSFYRKMPRGQVEPTFIHSDPMLGDWVAVLYLTLITPDTPPEDGTRFWRHIPTGRTRGPWEPRIARDRTQWESWRLVGALFNRLVVFPSDLFHSRSVEENFGEGETARLIQVAAGTGRLTLTAANAEHVIALPSPRVIH